MGLAASQARLLSITSRMSDNELRSQLINNAKLRLATDSSKVSDEYIAALNKTQLMFSNFDTSGNEQYQDLTFNSLTAYSSYNNQYGITNSVGQLLISGADAAKLESSRISKTNEQGITSESYDLDKFLESYGLKRKTTYFENFNNENIGYYDNYGRWVETDTTLEEMQDIYEANKGKNGIDHYGYEESLKSIEYGSYELLVDNYERAKSKYYDTIEGQMKSYLAGDLSINGSDFKYNNKTFETYFNEVMSLDPEKTSYGTINSYVTIFDVFYNKTAKLFDEKESQTFVNAIKDIRNGATAQVNGTEYEYSFEQGAVYGRAEINPETGEFIRVIQPETWYIYQNPSGGNTDIEGFGSGVMTQTPPAGGIAYKTVAKWPTMNEGSYTSLKYYESDSSDYDTIVDGKYVKYTVNSTGPDGSPALPYTYSNFDGTGIVDTYTVTYEELIESLKQLYQYYNGNVLANMDEQKFIYTDSKIKTAWEDYKKAAEDLAVFIYGESHGKALAGDATFQKDYIDYLSDPSWVLSQNDTTEDIDEDGIYDKISKSHYNPWANIYPTTTETKIFTASDKDAYESNYQMVKDMFLIEAMLEKYGEPKYTWIDENNPEENAEAKAQWYTNLFNRITKEDLDGNLSRTNYKTLNTNLAGSQEWLQFAFESGLVHMEQVDKSFNWVSTMYSNCSNINESTVDVDITIAEAKYKREMNKIQAKDKQYDLELKNIDTEHSALEKEYDSIKNVMKSNIEKNYKLFQNG